MKLQSLLEVVKFRKEHIYFEMFESLNIEPTDARRFVYGAKARVVHGDASGWGGAGGWGGYVPVYVTLYVYVYMYLYIEVGVYVYMHMYVYVYGLCMCILMCMCM